MRTSDVGRLLRAALESVLPRRPGSASSAEVRQRTTAHPGSGTRQARPRADDVRSGDAVEPTRTAYPGDFSGALRPVYSPDLDGDPDPGEVVWTWVPYEEDHSRGKDRPVLVVGHDGPWLLALVLTSKDHDRRDNPRGERWMDLGTGDWDRDRRPSEVRLDRVVRVDPHGVRREGAVLDRARFDGVVRALRTR